MAETSLYIPPGYPVFSPVLRPALPQENSGNAYADALRSRVGQRGAIVGGLFAAMKGQNGETTGHCFEGLDRREDGAPEFVAAQTWATQP